MMLNVVNIRYEKMEENREFKPVNKRTKQQAEKNEFIKHENDVNMIQTLEQWNKTMKEQKHKK